MTGSKAKWSLKQSRRPWVALWMRLALGSTVERTRSAAVRRAMQARRRTGPRKRLHRLGRRAQFWSCGSAPTPAWAAAQRPRIEAFEAGLPVPEPTVRGAWLAVATDFRLDALLEPGMTPTAATGSPTSHTNSSPSTAARVCCCSRAFATMTRASPPQASPSRYLKRSRSTRYLRDRAVHQPRLSHHGRLRRPGRHQRVVRG